MCVNMVNWRWKRLDTLDWPVCQSASHALMFLVRGYQQADNQLYLMKISEEIFSQVPHPSWLDTMWDVSWGTWPGDISKPSLVAYKLESRPPPASRNFPSLCICLDMSTIWCNWALEINWDTLDWPVCQYASQSPVRRYQQQTWYLSFFLHQQNLNF